MYVYCIYLQHSVFLYMYLTCKKVIKLVSWHERQIKITFKNVYTDTDIPGLFYEVMYRYSFKLISE